MSQTLYSKRLSLFSLHVVWKSSPSTLTKHTYSHILKDAKEDGVHAFACLSHLLENEIFTLSRFKKFILFCDNGPHFHSHLFWLYLHAWCMIQNIKYFEINYHEPGEGRCFLDRFFGALTCLERTFLLKHADISGALDYLYAWANKQHSTFYHSNLNRPGPRHIIPALIGGPIKALRQIIFGCTSQEFSCRLLSDFKSSFYTLTKKNYKQILSFPKPVTKARGAERPVNTKNPGTKESHFCIACWCPRTKPWKHFHCTRYLLELASRELEWPQLQGTRVIQNK